MPQYCRATSGETSCGASGLGDTSGGVSQADVAFFEGVEEAGETEASIAQVVFFPLLAGCQAVDLRVRMCSLFFVVNPRTLSRCDRVGRIVFQNFKEYIYIYICKSVPNLQRWRAWSDA